MAGLDQEIVAHYGAGSIYDRILDGLERAGLSVDTLTAAELKPVDEFHIGAFEATRALLDQVVISAGDRVLDIGSGIGGTARFVRASTGAEVTGIDLTPDFVETARKLSAMVGDDSSFQIGSALDMPFEAGHFDVAMLLHVGMNIADKPAMFAEAFRVLKPGGTFAVYDIMAVTDEPLDFPLPWAATAETSYLATPAEYRAAAAAAGFQVAPTRDRGDFARDFFARVAAQMAETGPPPFGVALTMGDKAPEMVANMVANLKAGRYAPVEMLCRRPG